MDTYEQRLLNEIEGMQEIATLEEDLTPEVLLLHSLAHMEGSPGILVDEEEAKVGPCTCYDNMCFHKGYIGALDKKQREHCPSVVEKGPTRRLVGWQEAVGRCRDQIGNAPKGERLPTWLACMKQELRQRGIKP